MSLSHKSFAFRRSASAIGATAILLGAIFSSRAIASMPIGQTVAAGDFDAAVRVLMNGGVGTGTIFHKEENAQYLKMCIVTADHVVKGDTLSQIGFRGTGQANTFNFTPIHIDIKRLGANGTSDYAMVGVTVEKSSLTAFQLSLLQAITPVTLNSAPGSPGFTMSEYGYGRSGTYDAGQPGFAYVWHSANAGEAYGTERFFDNEVASYFTYDSTYDAGATYDYSAMNWYLSDPLEPESNAVANEGQGNSGDSGAGLFASGELVGVLTTVWGDEDQNLYTNGPPITLEGFKAGDSLFTGSEGLGVRFGGDDVEWLEEQCDQMAMVPEPSTWALMCLGALGVVWQARRRKRGI